MLCLFSVEIFFRSNYLFLISSTIKISKKALLIISNKKISDHWKEDIILKYSLQLFKYSLKILLIFLSIIFIFLVADNLFSGFLDFTFSLNGILESILFGFGFAYFRKLIFK